MSDVPDVPDTPALVEWPQPTLAPLDHLATPADVLARWLTANPPSETTVEAWLADAATLLRWEIPDLDARIADGRLPIERVVMVQVAMVLRVLRNPDGAWSTSQTTGPFSVSTSFDRNETGGLHVTDDERALLRDDGRGQRAFTIDTTPAAAGHEWPPDPWFPSSPEWWGWQQ
jgi:hypothetical protein